MAAKRFDRPASAGIVGEARAPVPAISISGGLSAQWSKGARSRQSLPYHTFCLHLGLRRINPVPAGRT